MEHEPDFSTYTYNELVNCKQAIDKEKYPERYAVIVRLLNNPDFRPAVKAVANREINKYATFWLRYFAAWIDWLLFVFILYIECLILGVEFSTQNQFLQALNGVQFAIYAIFMHGLYGQTLGKKFMNVKVLNHETEAAITIKQALRRESVNLAITIAWVFILLFISVSLETTGTVSTGFSYAVIALGVAALIWGISEFITMLFNRKRRALHDFIGKTVVVRI